jgi:hypothetical protein
LIRVAVFEKYNVCKFKQFSGDSEKQTEMILELFSPTEKEPERLTMGCRDGN